MPKIHHEYFGPRGERRSEVLDAAVASKVIGDRVLIGFPMWTRDVEAADGSCRMVVVFQSEITGSVWGVFIGESWEV